MFIVVAHIQKGIEEEDDPIFENSLYLCQGIWAMFPDVPYSVTRDSDGAFLFSTIEEARETIAHIAREKDTYEIPELGREGIHAFLKYRLATRLSIAAELRASPFNVFFCVREVIISERSFTFAKPAATWVMKVRPDYKKIDENTHQLSQLTIELKERITE